MASQSRTQICKSLFSIFTPSSHTDCLWWNKDDKERQRTKVWMAWLIVSCHDILFPPPMSAPSTGGLEQRPCGWCDQKEGLMCNSQALLTVLPHVCTRHLASLHTHTKVQLKQYQLILQSQLAIKQRTQFPMIASWKRPCSLAQISTYPPSQVQFMAGKMS